MTTKTRKTQRSVVEPLHADGLDRFHAPQELIQANGTGRLGDETPPATTAIVHEVATPNQAALAAPTTNHQTELDAELIAFTWKGRILLFRQYQSTFRASTYLSDPVLEVDQPGSVWNEGETATYTVQLLNTTYFDLSDMHLRLSVEDQGGSASIVSPPGTLIKLGDIPYGSWSAPAEFQLKAVAAGNVELRLQIEGYIGPLRFKHVYDGSVPSSSAYRPGFRKTYTIVAS